MAFAEVIAKALGAFLPKPISSGARAARYRRPGGPMSGTTRRLRAAAVQEPDAPASTRVMELLRGKK